MRSTEPEKMPIFTSKAFDSLRLTDYMFLTLRPADIILSLVAESDFSLVSSRLLSSPLLQIRWEKNITLGEPPGFLHSWWWWVSLLVYEEKLVLSCLILIQQNYPFHFLCKQFLQYMSQAASPPLLPHSYALIDRALVSNPALHNLLPSYAQTVASFELSWSEGSCKSHNKNLNILNSYFM